MRVKLLLATAAIVAAAAGCQDTGAQPSPGIAAVAQPAPAATTTAPKRVTPPAARSTKPAPPRCAVNWGSGTKTTGYKMSTAPIIGVRAARQQCYDRLVIDLRAAPGGYTVRYVARVEQDGSGVLVPLRGGARLEIILRDPAYDINTGTPVYQPRNQRELVSVTGFRAFRQVAWAGSFEGQSTIGLGVRARLPFRVFTVGSRLVVDVAHDWEATR